MNLSGLFNEEWFKHHNGKTDFVDGTAAGHPFDLPPQMNMYDPTAVAAYDGLAPQYTPPEPWYEADEFQPTLPMHPPPTVTREQVQANADDHLQEIVEELEQLPARTDDPYLALRGGQEVDVLEAEKSQPDIAVDEVTKSAELQNVQNLEQIVEAGFRQLEMTMQQAFEQPMEDPYRQQLLLYEQQMQQIFNGSMMPGGFGPPPMS